MSPSLVVRSAFLAAEAAPFLRRMVMASSMLPWASVRAFLQSSKPAPVFSRSSLTIWAVIGMLIKFISLDKTLFGFHGRLAGAGDFFRRDNPDFFLDGDVLRQNDFIEIDFAFSRGRGRTEVGLAAGNTAAVALGNAVLDGGSDRLDNDADGFHRVVVAGNWVRKGRRVGVGVNQADAGNFAAFGFSDGDFLFIHVDDKEGRGQPVHLGDAIEIALHAGHFALDGGFFLLGQLGHFAAGLHLLEFFEFRNGALDRLVIGERAAEPAVHAEGHVDRDGGLADDVLRLALGADEEDVAAIAHEIFEERTGFFEREVRLLEVNDGDALAVVENVGLGTRVPALGLVPEMYACIEQVFDGDIHDLCRGYTGRPVGRLAIVAG